jgi:hypothetical protein
VSAPASKLASLATMNMIAARLVPLGAADGDNGADVHSAFEALSQEVCTRKVDNVFAFDAATNTFMFDFTEFETAYNETTPSALHKTTQFVVAPPSNRLKLTLVADPVEKWGINWAGMVLAETSDKRPRIIYLPGERTYDPAGLTGDAHASERIGKTCARTQAAITVAELNAVNVGASIEQIAQIQGATEDVIKRYHGRLTLWKYMFEQIKAAVERYDVAPYPDYVAGVLETGELDGELSGRSHTHAFLSAWREGCPRCVRRASEGGIAHAGGEAACAGGGAAWSTIVRALLSACGR